MTPSFSRRTGGEDHPSAPSVPESVPGPNPPVSGAESGQLEPPPARVSPAALAAVSGTSGGQGNPSRSTGREGTAAPGTRMPGAAQSPEGEASEHAPASPSGSIPLSGQDAREAWRAARIAQAKGQRTRRGKRPVRRQGDGYGPGMTRRMPPDGAA